MTSGRTYPGRIGHLFGVYGAWTLAGMATFFVAYEVWSAASWMTGTAAGRPVDLGFVGAVCTFFVAVQVIAVGVVLAGRRRITADFSFLGRPVHLDFCARDRSAGANPR